VRIALDPTLPSNLPTFQPAPHHVRIGGDVPLGAILSSVSLHNGQVAISAAKMTATRVRNLCDPAAVAYASEKTKGCGKL
jgi:hypothetical protein